MQTQNQKVTAALDGFPKRLAKVRGAESQRAFATRLGVFQQNVNRYENGTAPHMAFLIHLAQTDGINLNWLLLGVGPMKNRR